ncbi:MAG: hypothetical protein ACYTEU_00895 [Planctomycetota bacterium]|jgi:hypothetical protein
MKLIITFIVIPICFFSGCNGDGIYIGTSETPEKPAASVSDLTKRHYNWEPGQEIERIGEIWPSKSIGGNKYHIRCDDHRNPQLLSPKLDQLKLAQGTKIWVKGIIEYKHYERPQGSSGISCFVYPQTVCYLHVADFRTIEDFKIKAMDEN